MNAVNIRRQAFVITVLGASFGNLAYVMTGYTASLTDWCFALPIYFVGALMGYRGLRFKGVLAVVAALVLLHLAYVWGNRTLGVPYTRTVDLLLRQLAVAWILIPQTVLGYVALLSALECWHAQGRANQS